MKHLAFIIGFVLVVASTISRSVESVSLNASGRLVYLKDSKGNRVPDFSGVGYHSGEKDIPDVPVRLTLSPENGDDTLRIQEAIDAIGGLPVDSKGFRGALLLKRGVYHIGGSIRIMHSGVVLRGEGEGPDDTIVVAAGYDHSRHKRTLITVGDHHTAELNETAGRDIADEYVPVGAKRVLLSDASGFSVGDRVVIYRPSSPEWIASIGCDRIEAKWDVPRDARWVKEGDKAGFYFKRPRQVSENYFLKRTGESWEAFKKRLPFSEDGKRINVTRQWDWEKFHMYYERRITQIEDDTIALDAPVVHSIDKQFGGGKIIPFATRGRVTGVGLERLRFVSEFGPPVSGHPYGAPSLSASSENHAWTAIHLNRNSENCWVRNVKSRYFGYALVKADGKRATIQDCASLGHASVITGSRRYSFKINGQLNLVQRCLTIEGRHEFVNGARVWGPNVFVDCVGFESKSIVGPHNHYAVGNLYDTIRTDYYMESTYRGNRGTGHGWLATSTCYYNCEANKFEVSSPPGGVSWVIGCGKEGAGKQVKPGSLYYQQVRERLGDRGVQRLTSQKYLDSLGQYIWVKERMKHESPDLRSKCRILP